ncbi:MAG: helix-turn-helix domain-containing protein [Thermoplasmata archaeon]
MAFSQSPRFELVRIEIQIPSKIFFRGLSEHFPDATFRVRSRETLDDRSAIDVLEIDSPTPRPWEEILRSYPQVLFAEMLRPTPSGALMRVRHVPWPELMEVLRKVNLGREYPLVVRGGSGIFSVVACRKCLPELLRLLRSISDRVSVGAIRTFPKDGCEPLLSEHQSRLLQLALERGYFDVPRRVGLTELARELGRSKSTISRSLSLIERKLVESYGH